MKALIVCDDSTIIEKTKKIVEDCGCDTIIYRHVIKALDNIEEISPDLVVISACDFPRHWKTFVSYAETTKKEKIPTILFAPKGFSAEEEKKAGALGILGMYSDTSISETLKLRNLLLKLVPEKNSAQQRDASPQASGSAEPNAAGHSTAEKARPAQPESSSAGSGLLSRGQHFASLQGRVGAADGLELRREKATAKSSSLIRELHANLGQSYTAARAVPANNMIFTNPHSGTFVTGSIRAISTDEKTIEFAPDIKESVRKLASGDSILSISLKTASGMRHATGRIDRVDSDTMTLSVS